MVIKRSIKTLKKLINLTLKRSCERLKSAQFLIGKGLFGDSISRSYYAFLDAADALLLTAKEALKESKEFVRVVEDSLKNWEKGKK